ncbi:MAG: hypothetical protein PF495_03855 [Spirochaetales bacterium]|jgi:CRISPR/Cas system-associated endoribonuclease Cas2|nr:hypothetical protein [Spirochaetales bacterium]
MTGNTMVLDAKEYINKYKNSWLAASIARGHIEKLCKEIERLQSDRDIVVQETVDKCYQSVDSIVDKYSKSRETDKYKIAFECQMAVCDVLAKYCLSLQENTK